MYTSSQKAFTMLELVFVIVVIGILSAIAIPKFAANKSDAVIAKAKATVASVRLALSSERQKRILKGDFANPITTLHTAGYAFSTFSADRDGDTNDVLEYYEPDCTTLGKSQECWSVSGSAPNVIYSFNMPLSGTADFNITNSRFVCDESDSNCQLLTR
ncbi:MAG: type II secretion system protein [Campylobacterota bacterium]|nr:type II secretion system protein [Campylobacterota bacterium]